MNDVKSYGPDAKHGETDFYVPTWPAPCGPKKPKPKGEGWGG